MDRWTPVCSRMSSGRCSIFYEGMHAACVSACGIACSNDPRAHSTTREGRLFYSQRTTTHSRTVEGRALRCYVVACSVSLDQRPKLRGPYARDLSGRATGCTSAPKDLSCLLRRSQSSHLDMGLFKLAIIGGAAYYVGKKFSENREAHANQHGYQGPCSRHRGHHDQNNQPEQPPQVYGPHPGMTRDLPPYQDYPPQSMSQYPVNKANERGFASEQERSYASGAMGHDGKQMVKYQAEERMDASTPPAYAGAGRMSPQMRMYPGESGVMNQDSKKPYTAEQYMWK
ncbi:hypothetical protein R6Q59_009961 [Mikania micrantha]